MFNAIVNRFKNPRIILLLFSLFLYLLWVYFPLNVTFMQNDDWVYYRTVENFLSGNLTLHPYSGPTLYLQALAGALFAQILPLYRLSLLTLLMAVISFFLTALILTEFYKKPALTSALISLLFFFNPLTQYLILGFMTGMYFLPFLLLSIYLLLKYEQSENGKYIIISLLAAFLGLLIRQVSLAIPLSFSIYFAYKKNWRNCLLASTAFILFYAFYQFVLPLTPRILEVPLQYHHLLNFDYTYAVVYGSLLVLTAYLLPLAISVFDIRDFSNKKQVLLIAVFAVVLSIGLNRLFDPESVSWGEFPYFENTLERTGFFPRGIAGTKYQFMGNYDLYRFWDFSAKALVSTLISYLLIIKRKQFINFYSIFIFVYLGLMVITETFYDRYLVILIPITIFYLVSISSHLNRVKTAFIGVYVLFLSFFGYQFSMDFVKVNKYIWDKSEQIVNSENTPPSQIRGTHAWLWRYEGLNNQYEYIFSYDSPEVNEELNVNYALIEERTIEYPLNIFVNPKIYLYKLK